MAADQGPNPPNGPRLLKRDLFGAVELWELGPLGPVILRRRLSSAEARDLALPAPLRWVGPALGRLLAAREHACLLRIEQCLQRDPALAARLSGRLPRPIDAQQAERLAALLTGLGRRPDPRWDLGSGYPGARRFVTGTPLQLASRLSRRYFEELEQLVGALHRVGLCHNDLHKEPNLLVCEDGSPALIDFQLASWHALGSRAWRIRSAEDVRHVRKHARRYWTQAGRLTQAGPLPEPGPRSRLARLWMRYGKPVYRALTRGLWRWRDGERPRPKAGPWPEWID
jgi:hypothetical protein